MAGKKNYDSLDAFIKDLKSDIEDVMSKEVFEEVRNIEMEHIQSDVLNRYHPKIYERRSSGGIEDRSNISGKVRDMKLTVNNDTPYNSGYGTYNHGNTLATLLNEGSGGKHKIYYDFMGEFEQPTYFLENTQYEIDNTDRVKNVLTKGLKAKGYEVK